MCKGSTCDANYDIVAVIVMTLVEKQHLFSRLAANLISFATELGYGIAFGDAMRSSEEANRLAAAGKGLSRSLHCDRLAIDLILRKQDGSGKWIYLTKSEDYVELGDFWKKQHELCRWGGDFVSRPDGNHFSITHEGRA